MGYKDSYETYIDLSRRDLQRLCKKYNLPANKSQSDLAKSLASYFKKNNSPLANTGKASSVPAEVNSQDKAYDKNHDGNVNECDKLLDTGVSNELKARSPITIESSQEGIKIVNAINGIVDGINDNSNCSDNLLRDQGLMSGSPTMGEEQTPPHDPSSDNMKPQSPNKFQNQELPPQFTCSDKSTVRFAAESSTVTETAEKPVFFQFFVASEEGISLFVDLNSGPSDWVHCLKGKICRHPVTQSCSISSLVKDANSSHSSALCEEFPSESIPVESICNLSDIPTQIENKLGGIQGEGNEEMQLPKTVERDSKELCEISINELNSLVPCQSGGKLAGESTDLATKGLSVLEPADKVDFLDSATADSLLPSSDALQVDLSVPKASDSSGLTLDKNLKRVLNQGSEKLSQSFRVTLDKNLKRPLNQGSEKLSQNKKHHVAKESNKNGSSTRILRSSRTLVKEEEEDKISGLPRRSTRLVSK